MDKLILRSLFVVIFVLCFFSSWTTAIAISSDYEDEIKPASWGRCPWIRDKLKNGRVKMRSRGRIAKFACNVGYELIGKRFATCVRGQWNNDVPICVSAGCYRLPKPENSKVTDMYRGALLMYDCLPGYVRHGPSSLYCDGSKWSEAAPICEVASQEPTFSCDFEESDLCGWTHDPSHDVDWRRNQFITPSGHFGTGPSGDHTFGLGKAGFYMYLEASTPQKENDVARLFSPVYPSSSSPGCFVFWYHMYGNGTGSLKVYIKQESDVFGNIPESWERFGDQGNQWLRGVFTVPEIPENFQIILEGVRGPNYESDIAIDDVNLMEENCSNVLIQSESTSPAEASSDSCRGRCSEDIQEITDCSCSRNCAALNGSACCPDYTIVCNAVTVPTEPDEWQETMLEYSTAAFFQTSVAITETTENPEASNTITASTIYSTSPKDFFTLITEMTDKGTSVSSTSANPQRSSPTVPSTASITTGLMTSSGETRMKTKPRSTSTLFSLREGNDDTSPFSPHTPIERSDYMEPVASHSYSTEEIRSSLTLTTSSNLSNSNEPTTTTITHFDRLPSFPQTTIQDSLTTSGLDEALKTRLVTSTSTDSTPTVSTRISSTSYTTENSSILIASTKTLPPTVNPPNIDTDSTSYGLGSSTRELTYRLPFNVSTSETITIKPETTGDVVSERVVSPQKEDREAEYRSSDLSTKSESPEVEAGNSSVTGAIVAMCLMIGAATAAATFFFQRKKRKQAKLAEDSEIKYLSDNEIVEFYESSPKSPSRR